MEKIKSFFIEYKALFKSNTKHMIFTIIVALILGAILFGGGNNDSATKNSDLDNINNDIVSESDTLISVKLDGKNIGDYGVWTTLNATSEYPDTFIAYYLPAGEYTATNLDPNYLGRVYVWSTEIEVVDGFEYQKDCSSEVWREVGETKSFTIPENYYIQIYGSDSGASILIEQK